MSNFVAHVFYLADNRYFDISSCYYRGKQPSYKVEDYRHVVTLPLALTSQVFSVMNGYTDLEGNTLNPDYNSEDIEKMVPRKLRCRSMSVGDLVVLGSALNNKILFSTGAVYACDLVGWTYLNNIDFTQALMESIPHD